MSKSKVTIIILGILLTISVIGNITLIIKVNNTSKEETVEYNPNHKYVGKWEYNERNPDSYSSTGYLISLNSILTIDDKSNITLTKTEERAYSHIPENVITKTIYKGEINNNTIILKEKIDNDGNKKEIREIHNIILYSDDTLAYQLNNKNDSHYLYIKK